jgi:hypothetical protein
MFKFRVLIGASVVAVLIAWFGSQALPASRDALAANQPFAVMLPVMVRLEAGQLFQLPAQVLDTIETPTETPSATLTATPTNTPTITPSALPTNTAECDLAIKQNLQVHVSAPGVAMVTNSSSSCTYPIGLASYSMFDNNLSHQQLFESQTVLIGPGQTQTLTVGLPGCAYQLDLFYGALIEQFDPQHGQVYGDRILITRVVRDDGLCVPGTTTPTASPTATDSPTPTQGGN